MPYPLVQWWDEGEKLSKKMNKIYLISEIGGAIKAATNDVDFANYEALRLSQVTGMTHEVLSCQWININN